MTEKYKRLIILLIAHYFIYRFYFDFVSTAVQQIILFGILGLYILMNFKSISEFFFNIGRYKTLFIAGNLFYISAILVSFFTPLLYKTYDFTYFSVHVRYVSYLISFVVLLDLMKRWLGKENLKDHFLKVFIVSSRNYVLVSIVMLALPRIREFWIAVTLTSARGLELITTNPDYIARYGWAGYSGFSITFLMTLAVIFALYLILKDIESQQSVKKMDVLSIVILLTGNAFYGRAGLLASLAVIGLSVVYVTVKYRKIQLALTFTGLLIGLFLLLTVVQQYNEALADWYSWVVTPFRNLLTTGSFNVSSTEHLWSMYFIPELKTLLLGDGFYTNLNTGTYYKQVDVGYLRPVLFGGLPLLLQSYLIPILLSLGIGFMRRENRFMAFLIVFVLFVFEIKGEVIIPLIPTVYILFLSESQTLTTRRAKAEKTPRLHTYHQKLGAEAVEGIKK